ncbi:UDP-glucose:undecaprenyl-phosphate glucose-1-phosphate transferase [Variibacter gotjawalensis]|uniref:UDP-glucose:undecaprenyl-phosphate glucose-1-phosphate transferase n=1 Tax=Variibacter gotjawalensis TaxID=1333996 RepID=A0A0S3PX77_9BRAD|nr:undecaprenyl-phosphate glucose phosphotransferase [Variibacter gotjawalensis]NIK46360.1 Undecaprenyl-phosphate glucose phosphotransferase [Variibacter gotjawalensis]RZS48270.1 Undecaprenyl-phosphate glucose phosphotransferase [Variibacter gotjawalensis]BAT60530.1 UDP-glucose:undecaprenyl-phosphate glucose-1-phosphate transferase [Variibacter gotjawalensis]
MTDISQPSLAAAALGATARSNTPRILSPAAEKIAALPVMPALSPIVLAGIVRMIDFGAIIVLGFALYAVYVVPTYGVMWQYVPAILAIAVLTILAFQSADIYHVTAFRSPVGQVIRLVPAWTIVMFLAITIVFFARLEQMFSRVWLVALYVAGVVLLVSLRLALATLVRHWTKEGRLDRRAVVVGGGPAGGKLIEALGAQQDSDVHVIGLFDDRGDDRAPVDVAGFTKLGSVDDLIEFARRTRVDLVLFSLPFTAESRLLQMLRKLWVLPVDIRLAAHLHGLRLRPRAYSYIGNLPMMDVYDKPITDWDVVMKNVFDRVVGALLLLALSPIMMIVAIAIKLDSKGPVFFRQKRYGFNNELIEVFKFRSMYTDQCDPTASKLVTKNDSRVTRVGAFIRKTSIDELPQLINVVFKGNLSLVGPRPHALHAKAEDRLYDEAVDGYFARHRVKPGITGWAQINGWRGETDTSEKIVRRVEHDLYYIENWSVVFDLYILARTPFALAKSENAY